MRSKRDAWLVLLAIVFYSSYAWDQFHPPLVTTSFTVAFGITMTSLVGLVIVFCNLPLDRWVYLISALAPLEISGPRWIFPSLSPIDYICAAALIDSLRRHGLVGFIRSVYENFGMTALAAWLAFYIFGICDAHYSDGSIRGLLRWGEFLFCFTLAASAAKESISAQKSLAALLAWSGMLLSIVAIFQFCRSHADYTMTYATFQQHNGFGAYLSLCLPAAWGFAMNGKRQFRTGWILQSAIITMAFLLSYSRGAWMGIIVGLCGAILFHVCKNQAATLTRKRIVFISTVIFMAATVLVPLRIVSSRPDLGQMKWSLGSGEGMYGPRLPTSTTLRLWSSAERPYYWRAAHVMIQTHPWLGIGPGRYDTDLPKYLDTNALNLYLYEMAEKHRVDFWSHLHSMYLQMLIQYGWIGFSLWVTALAALIAPRLALIRPDASLLSLCFLVSVIAFFVHNTVDILFVNSLDLLMVFLLVFSA